MLYGLKGTHPVDGELYQEFTKNERETAVAIARIWHAKGWKPLLLDRYWHSCRISALNNLIGQRQAA
jgi:hypothetical protein